MSSYSNPVIDADFADPGVLWDARTSSWYAYSTNAFGKGVQAASSRDFLHWQVSPYDALPGPHPPWTGKPGFTVWAPEVIPAPQGRPGYLMYASAWCKNTDTQSIAAAYSHSSPLGPFRFLEPPLVAHPDKCGDIDPQPFDDPRSGLPYLIWKYDGDVDNPTHSHTWIQQRSPDGLSLVGPRHPLLGVEQEWQDSVVEAPYLTYHAPSSTYVLFYSSGVFTTEGYAIGFAKSKNLFGPYKNNDQPLIGTMTHRGVRGPGGQSIVKGPFGADYLVYHQHDAPNGEGGRRVCIQRLEWHQDGTPYLPSIPSYRAPLTLGRESEQDTWSSPGGQGGGSGSAHGAPPQINVQMLGKGLKKVAKWAKEY